MEILLRINHTTEETAWTVSFSGFKNCAAVNKEYAMRLSSEQVLENVKSSKTTYSHHSQNITQIYCENINPMVL